MLASRLALMAALLSLPIRALAAEMAVSPEQMCLHADLVVIAEGTSSETLWTEGPRGGIETRVWLAVHEAVRGTAPPAVEVVLPGGERGGVRHWVEDVPVLGLDRTYLLFLSRDGEAWRTVAGQQAAILVQRHPKEPWPSVEEALGSLGACLGR
ncbi:MAG: hypothetical protein JRJ84_09470 [Deltaproteobacteria bacterium]|nr:hypothetical protein [Deltaproteobacteria bacterium]